MTPTQAAGSAARTGTPAARLLRETPRKSAMALANIAATAKLMRRQLLGRSGENGPGSVSCTTKALVMGRLRNEVLATSSATPRTLSVAPENCIAGKTTQQRRR
jgi:hypothetical protein